MSADDIVTRLRTTALEGCSVTDWTKLSFDIQDAADEIERLRAFADDLEAAADSDRVRSTRQILALEMGTNRER